MFVCLKMTSGSPPCAHLEWTDWKEEQKNPQVSGLFITSSLWQQRSSFYGLMIETDRRRSVVLLCGAADGASWARDFYHDNVPKKIMWWSVCFAARLAHHLLPTPPHFLHWRSNLLISVSWFSLAFRDTTKSHYVCHGLYVQAIHLLEEERGGKDQRCSYNHL